MSVDLIFLVATLLVCFGALIGCVICELGLQARHRRQVAMQRSLNSQWQELEAARKSLAVRRWAQRAD
jgi:hypothetical protein